MDSYIVPIILIGQERDNNYLKDLFLNLPVLYIISTIYIFPEEQYNIFMLQRMQPLEKLSKMFVACRIKYAEIKKKERNSVELIKNRNEHPERYVATDGQHTPLTQRKQILQS